MSEPEEKFFDEDFQEEREEEFFSGNAKINYTAPVMADVRKEWGWVKRGVEEIIKSSSNLTFRAEDVYASCLTQRSILWITHEGFVVSTTDIDMFTDEKIFFIWLAWAKTKGTDIAARHQAFFETVARETGHTKLELRSPHLGLMNYLTQQLGWEINNVSYIKKI